MQLCQSFAVSAVGGASRFGVERSIVVVGIESRRRVSAVTRSGRGMSLPPLGQKGVACQFEQKGNCLWSLIELSPKPVAVQHVLEGVCHVTEFPGVFYMVHASSMVEFESCCTEDVSGVALHCAFIFGDILFFGQN